MSALLAAFHYLAIGLGFSGLVLRMMELKYATAGSSIKRIMTGDTLWGIAFLLWVVTGLSRAFLGYEKGTPYYMQSHWFWLKMTVFVVILLLELKPMITLIKWRMQKKASIDAGDLETTRKMYLISHVELGFLAFMPIIASIMARGGF